MIVRTLVLFALGGIFLPNVYTHQAAILGFSDKKPVLSALRVAAGIYNAKESEGDTVPEGAAIAYVAAGANTYAESVFEDMSGVFSVTPGAMHGDAMPADSVKIVYDPKTVSYAQLLTVFWNHIDPTDPEGQFSDRGEQYRTAVYYQDGVQRRTASASLDKVRAVFGDRTATELLPVGTFRAASDRHQDFFRKHPDSFASYIEHSGRDVFLPAIRSALNGQAS